MPREVDTSRKLTPGQERQINTSLGIKNKVDEGPRSPIEPVTIVPKRETIQASYGSAYRPSIKAKSSLALLTKAAEAYLKDVLPLHGLSGQSMLTKFLEEIDAGLAKEYEAFLKRNKSLPPD